MIRNLVAIVLALAWLLGLTQVAMAEDPVYFADANLKTAVERQLYISDPTPTDMLLLIGLNAEDCGIVELTGIEYAINLQYLNLNKNQISNISPLSGLTNLTWLDLSWGNQISDLTPLSGLTNLVMLTLNDNQISNISALSGLTNLQYLHLNSNQIRDISALSGLINLGEVALGNNQVSDISVLSGLTKLGTVLLTNNQVSDISVLSGRTNLFFLELSSNPLNIEAYCDIPHILSNNPGIYLYVDPCPYSDFDNDEVPDTCDNCPSTPNGLTQGTCIIGNNMLCYSHEDCGTFGYCSHLQEDSYPPGGNGIGDACDCEGGFNCDRDVDGSDTATFKHDFGRGIMINPCVSELPCNGDFDCDIDVDGTDATRFKRDFGRSKSNPCPSCESGVEWCGY